jgi:hypothetical protein
MLLRRPVHELDILSDCCTCVFATPPSTPLFISSSILMSTQARKSLAAPPPLTHTLSLIQTCLLSTAVLSSLLTAQYTALEAGVSTEALAAHNSTSARVLVDILLTGSGFIVPTIVLFSQVGGRPQAPGCTSRPRDWCSGLLLRVALVGLACATCACRPTH